MKILLQIEGGKEISKAFSDMYSNLLEVGTNVVTAILIFVIGYIFSKIISKGLRRTLVKFGVDKLGDKLDKIDIIQKAHIEIKISTVLSKIVYYILIILFTVAATSVLGIPEISNLFADIFNFIPHLIVAIIVLVLGTLVADAIRKMAYTGLKSLGAASPGLLSSIIFYFLFINIVISALSQAEINTDFLASNISILIAGVVGAFAIGYGLASKDVMANMIASFYNSDRFRVGDKVTINNVTGIISKVNKSSITIKTDSAKVLIPLNKAINETVEFHD